MSSLYCALCLGLSAYALSIASKHITLQIKKIIGMNEYFISIFILILELSLIFPLTIYQNYQNYRKLSVVLISSILMSLGFLVI